jgi:hypothetical protein
VVLASQIDMHGAIATLYLGYQLNRRRFVLVQVAFIA